MEIVRKMRSGADDVQIEKWLVLRGVDREKSKELMIKAEEVFMNYLLKEEKEMHFKFDIRIVAFWFTLLMGYTAILVYFFS